MKRGALLWTTLAVSAYVGVVVARPTLAVADQDHAKKVGEKHDHKAGDHDHGEEHKGDRKDLGKQQIAGHTVQVTQIGEVKPGEEAIFILTVSGGSTKPKAIRGWVGAESGERSIKSKAEDEEKEYHLHHEVSKPLPANAKLWIEIETATGKKKGSYALKK